MSYTIEKLTSSDLAHACQLMEAWWENGKSTKPDQSYLHSLLSKDDFHLYVAIADNKVVGGLSAYELVMFNRKETEMFLYEIGVEKDYQRHGIARALINALKTTCHEKSISEIFVATSLENEAAKNLYLSTGGEEEIAPIYSYDLKQS